MISGKNLLSNIASQANAKPSSSSNSTDDVLSFAVQDSSDEKKDDKKDPNAVDPNSFVSLLSQFQAKDPAANEVNSKSGSDAQDTLISELSNSTNQKVATDSQQSTDVADLLATQNANDSNFKKVDTENPALNWLESENYKTLQATGDNVELAGKVSTTKAQPEVSAAINATLTKVSTPTEASSASTVTNLTAQNPLPSLQELSSALNNADKMAAAVMGDKSDSKSDDLVSSLSNASSTTSSMPVVTNQPQQIIEQPKSLEIPVSVIHPQWGDKFADHIAWMGNNDVKSAVIKIHPEELGPIEISVKVEKDSALVNIISHSAQVRDVMDQAVPKLRDMMSTEGLNLTEINISVDQRSGNAFAQQNNSQQQNDGTAFTEGDEEVKMVSTVKKPPKGLVDYFA